MQNNSTIRDMSGRDISTQLRVVAMMDGVTVEQLKARIRTEYEKDGPLPKWLVNDAYGEYCTVRLNALLQ